MDFGDFGKAVRRAARDAETIAERATPAAERVAPVYKVGTLAALTYGSGGAVTPILPFLAVLPAQAFLPPQVSVPLFLFSQPFREGVGESVARDSAPAAVSAGVAYFLTPSPT